MALSCSGSPNRKDSGCCYLTPHLFLPLSLFHFFLEFHDVYIGFSVGASIALSAGENGGRWLVHTVGITVLPGLDMEAQGLLLSPENLWCILLGGPDRAVEVSWEAILICFPRRILLLLKANGASEHFTKAE